MINDENRAVITKLRDKYQDTADRYWHDYQFDGTASQLRTYERNQALADALTEALNGEKRHAAYIDLKLDVLDIPTDDPDECVSRVKWLKKKVDEDWR